MEKVRVDGRRLGKDPYKHDDRTIRLSEHLKQLRPSVTAYDARTVAPGFPARVWGNNEWGDCVLAGRANQFLILEEPQWNEWLPLSDDMVVNTYKQLTGSQSPGDSNDTGLNVLDALNNWRAGWPLQLDANSPSGGYKIDCFGSLNYKRMSELKSAIQYLHGVTFGFDLPRAAQSMGQVWDCPVDDKGAEWEPGSWGGHCVVGVAFDPHGIHVLTWGKTIMVTSRFLKRYCDEAWGIVPSLDNPGASKIVDVKTLEQQLKEIGAT